MDEQRGSVPQHEQTNHLSLETRQTLFNWKQSVSGDQMEAEYLAQQQEAEQRARYIVNFNPCGVE